MFITDEQVEQLRSEARRTGDEPTIALCAMALGEKLTRRHRATLREAGWTGRSDDAHAAREVLADQVADAKAQQKGTNGTGEVETQAIQIAPSGVVLRKSTEVVVIPHREKGAEMTIETCTHPDHVDGVSCEDRAVGCSATCTCCIPTDIPPTNITTRNADEALEAAERLAQIKDELKELVEEARTLLRDKGMVYERARSYWLAHILTNLDHDHEWVSRETYTMQDAIDELHSLAEDDNGEDDHEATPTRETNRSTGDGDASNLVPSEDGCPVCSERDADALVWDDDGTLVTCATCGAQYCPPKPVFSASTPHGRPDYPQKMSRAYVHLRDSTTNVVGLAAQTSRSKASTIAPICQTSPHSKQAHTLLYIQAKGAHAMTTNTTQQTKTTQNEFGGTDYRGVAGLARTAVDDGETTVYSFTRHGQADLMVWQARFSSATPTAVITAAIEEAQRLADQGPNGTDESETQR